MLSRCDPRDMLEIISVSVTSAGVQIVVKIITLVINNQQILSYTPDDLSVWKFFSELIKKEKFHERVPEIDGKQLVQVDISYAEVQFSFK